MKKEAHSGSGMNSSLSRSGSFMRDFSGSAARVVHPSRLVTTGRLASWRAAYAQVETLEGNEIAIDPAGAELLGVGVGDTIMHVGRT